MWPGPWHSGLGTEARDQAPLCPYLLQHLGKPLSPEPVKGGQLEPLHERGHAVTLCMLALLSHATPGGSGVMTPSGMRRHPQ